MLSLLADEGTFVVRGEKGSPRSISLAFEIAFDDSCVLLNVALVFRHAKFFKKTHSGTRMWCGIIPIRANTETAAGGVHVDSKVRDALRSQCIWNLVEGRRCAARLCL